MTEEQQNHVEHIANSFTNVILSIRKNDERIMMLEDIIIYNTNMTKNDIVKLYRQIMSNPHLGVTLLTDEKYITFLSDFIDCNFNADALRIIYDL